MKKLLLLFSLFTLTAGVAFAGDGSSETSPIVFSWEKDGNPDQAAGKSLWYEVNIADNVSSDENIMLYLVNKGDATTTVKVHIYGKFGTTTNPVIKQLEDEQSKEIAKSRYYTYEIGQSQIKALGLKVVLVKLTTTTQPINFSAEPVEPGEKDPECLNALTLNWDGTTYTNVGKDQWYLIDMSTARAATDKELVVEVENLGATEVKVEAGLSFDCPSTGLTDKSMTIAANGKKKSIVSRSRLSMLNQDEILIKVNSANKLKFTAYLQDITKPVEYTDVPATVPELELDQVYTVSSEQWYSVDLSQVNVKRELPEVSVTNLSSTSSAEITLTVVFEKHSAGKLERSFTLAKGGVRLQEIQRNMIESYAKDYTTAYVKVATTQTIEFFARMKKRVEGDACKSAKAFDWDKGAAQMANTTVWYVLDIKDAKEHKDQDIELFVYNKGSKPATVKAEVALSCPYDKLETATRTIPVGTTPKSQVIKRSLYSALATDSIWVCLTTDQNIEFNSNMVASTFVTDETCNTAVEFPLDGSAVVLETADSPKWYKVDLNNIILTAKDKGQVPTITVKNEGDASATIKAELSFECPVVSEPQSRTQKLGAQKELKHQLTISMIEKIDENYDYAYIRVTSNQKLSIKAEYVYQNEGELCSTAEEIDWTLGYVEYKPEFNDDNDPIGYWYAIPIKEAKEQEQDIEVKVINQGKEDVKVTADLSFDCPTTGLTTQSVKLAKNGGYKSKTIYNASFAGYKVDYVYVRVTAAQPIRIEAKRVDNTATPVDLCNGDTTLVDFDWENGQNIVLAGQRKWFKVGIDTLRKDDTYKMVPKVVIENKGTATANVKVLGSTKCVTKSFQSKQHKVELNGYQYTIERNNVQSIDETVEYVYVQVSSDQDIRIYVDMVNPDNGTECLKAEEFDWDNGNTQEADQSKWYVIDLSSLQAKSCYGADITIENTDGFAGTLKADLFYDCNDTTKASESVTRKYAKNYHSVKHLGSEMIQGLANSRVYLRVYSTQALKFTAKEVDEGCPEPDPNDPCQDNTKLFINVDNTHVAGDAWYLIDIKAFRETTGDAKFTIKPVSADTKIKAEISYTCPVASKLQTRSLELKSGDGYTRDIDRKTIDNIAKDTAYLHLTSDQDFVFRVDVEDDKGQSCDADPIEYDWQYGVAHPANKTLWYVVKLDTLKNNPPADLRLAVYNKTGQSAEVTVDIYGECNDATGLLATETRTIPAADSLATNRSRGLFEGNDFADIHLRLVSDQEVFIRAYLIGELPTQRFDTTYNDTVCAGFDAYVDKITNTPIPMAISADTTWNDTISGMIDNQYRIDTIWTYNVYVRTNPVLPQIEVEPVVRAGQVVDITAAQADIQNKLNTLIASNPLYPQVDNVEWQVQEADNSWVPFATSSFATTAVDSDVDYVNFKYVITYDCDGFPNDDESDVAIVEVLKDTVYIFNGNALATEEPQMNNAENQNVESRLCAPAERFGQYVTQDTTWFTYTDTVYTKSTIGRIGTIHFDYNEVKTVIKLTLPADPANLPAATAMVGDVLDLTAADADVKADIAAQQTAGGAQVENVDVDNDGVKWQVKNGTTETDINLNDYVLDAAGTVEYRFVITGECQELTSNWYQVVVSAYPVTRDTTYTYVYNDVETLATADTLGCAPFDWHDKTITADETWVVTSDTDFVYVDTTYVDGVEDANHNIHTDATVNVDKKYTTTTYSAFVYRALVAPATLTAALADAKVGDALDFTAADAEVRADLDQQVADSSYIYTDVAWQVKEAAATDFVTVGGLTFTTTTAGTLAYRFVISGVGCQQADIVSNEFTINVTEDVVIVIDTTYVEDYANATYTSTPVALDTIGCAGYTWHGVTVDADQTWAVESDTVYTAVDTTYTVVDETHVTGTVNYQGDYITTTYTAAVYKEVVLPTNLDTKLTAVCGEKIPAADVNAVIDEVKALFTAADVTPLQSVVIEAQDGAAWKDIKDVQFSAQVDKVNARLVVTTECGASTVNFTLQVEKPSSYNSSEYGFFASRAVYGGRLLIVDQKSIEQYAEGKGLAITAEDVHWYHVNGQPDYMNVAGDAADTPLTDMYGWYYTRPGAPVLEAGDYYVKIEILATEVDECGRDLYSDLAHVDATASEVITLNPTVAQPGEDLHIEGLYADMTYVVNVYNLTGMCTATYTVSNVTSFTIAAEQLQGYYMVKVEPQDSQLKAETFKYVVK